MQKLSEKPDRMIITIRQPVRILVLLAVLVTPGMLSAQDKNNSWPIFRGNQGLSGNTQVILPKALKVAWISKMASGTKSSPVIGNNCIFVGSDDGTLYCLSLVGKSIWTFSAGNGIEAPPLFYDNTVYVGSLDGTLFAVDARTGRQRWMYRTEGQISGSPNFFWVLKNYCRKLRLLFVLHRWCFRKIRVEVHIG
jgi:outer membrane protein assembly factor BamB